MVTGCNRIAAPDASGEARNGAPWAPGEVSRLVSTGDEVSTVEWVMEVDAGSSGDTWVFRFLRIDPSARAECTVEVVADSLAPLRMEWRRETADGTVVIQATYGPEKVTIQALSGGEATSSELELPPPPYYDNEEILMVLRTLPLEPEFEGVLVDIVTRQKAVVEVRFSVQGKETLTTPAGVFSCWVVELRPFDQTAWVAKEDPHQIVQYANRRTGTVMQLAEYQPGEP